MDGGAKSMSNRRLDIDTFTILSAKDPEYPCQYCARGNRNECGFNFCVRWMNWFGREWRTIRRTFCRDGVNIKPAHLSRDKKDGLKGLKSKNQRGATVYENTNTKK